MSPWGELIACSHSSERSHVEREEFCVGTWSCDLLQVKIVHQLVAWVQFSVHTLQKKVCPHTSWLPLYLKYPCDLHVNYFSCSIYSYRSTSRPVWCFEHKERVICISVCLTDFFHRITPFLRDVNLPLLIYVWGRNFLSVIQQQRADK